MSTEHEAQRALQELLEHFERKQTIRRGLLGDSNGVVLVPGRSGWAYIRYREDLNRLSLVRYLLQEQLPDGTPVVVGREHADDPFEQVLGQDWVMYAYAPTSSSVVQNATQVIGLSDLSPGRVLATDPVSLSVDVRAFLYRNGTDAVEYGGSSIDLTGSVPGVPGHRLTLVYIDLDTDALAAEDGAIVAIGTNPTAPTVPANAIPLGLVDLANGDASIPNDDITQYKAMYQAIGETVGPGELGGYVRGSIFRGGAADWEVYDASGDGYALVGDGTDILSDQTPAWSGTHTFTPGDDQGIILVMDAGQSVDIFQIKDSGGNVMSGYDERGIPFADGNTDPTNFFAGPDAGNTTNTAVHAIGIGSASLDSLTDGYNIVAIGGNTGTAVTSGNNLVLIGRDAGEDNTGSNSVMVGSFAGTEITTGDELVIIGSAAGGLAKTIAQSTIVGRGAGPRLWTSTGTHNNTFGYRSGYGIDGAGSNNLMLGSYTGYTTGALDSCIFIGHSAGYRQNAVSSYLLIDNQQRAAAATELTHAILYGTMAANPEDQQLTINVDSLTIGTDADADVVMNWVANSNSGVITWMEDEDHFDVGDTLKTSAGRIVNTTRKTDADSPYTTVNADHNLFCDTDGGVMTVNLQAGVDGRYLRIINCGSSGNDVTLTPNGAELLLGVNANYTLADAEVLVIVYETTEGWL